MTRTSAREESAIHLRERRSSSWLTVPVCAAASPHAAQELDLCVMRPEEQDFTADFELTPLKGAASGGSSAGGHAEVGIASRQALDAVLCGDAVLEPFFTNVTK
jgi:hypothetical protein